MEGQNKTSGLLELLKNENIEELRNYFNEHSNEINKKNRQGNSSLLWASQHGKIKVMEVLLEFNVDINIVDKHGNNALIIASKVGFSLIVNFILGAYDIDIDSKNSNLNTALMKASKYGYSEIVKSLLLKKAKTELTNKDGSTALLIACMKGHLNIVQICP